MEAVQKTNDDATSSKRSAVELGYWNDPYLKAMVSWNPNNRQNRKSPEIHLGYYTRLVISMAPNPTLSPPLKSLLFKKSFNSQGFFVRVYQTNQSL